MNRMIEELNTYLDEQTTHVEQTLDRLDTLRASVIRRDEGALQELMKEVEYEQEFKDHSDRIQQHLRLKLSALLECSPQEVNISRLCEQLHEPERGIVRDKQHKLQRLVRRLQNEHISTEMLLRDCARFNRLLLTSILGKTNQTTTYNARGQQQWNVHCDLMNAKM